MKYNRFYSELTNPNSEFYKKILKTDDKENNHRIVKEYLNEWQTYRKEKMYKQEEALNFLFQTYKQNDNLQQVLLKVACLNDFYSTNIWDTFTIAKTICTMNIDDELLAGNLNLIRDISSALKTNGHKRNEYSFLTKYCSFHNPEKFPIFDSRNEAMLKFYKDEFWKDSFDPKGDYKNYKNMIDEYRKTFGLEDFSYKEIDRFNWTFCNMVIDKYSKTSSDNI